MKNAITLVCVVFIGYFINAQSSTSQNDRSPIYDYTNPLKSSDTIPGFESSVNKLKLEGVVYESDGTTPAKNVVIFINQPNENGDFDLRKENGKRYVHNRGWVKTDENGRYTFYTFVPGNDFRFKQLQQIFPTVKAPEGSIYELDTFLFDHDPLLTKRCRKLIAKKDDPSRILKLNKENGILIAKKNITLRGISNVNDLVDVDTEDIIAMHAKK